MFNLRDEILMERVDGYQTYYKGREYFLADKVKGVKTNPSNDYFQSTVHGSSDYTSSVNFNSMGSIVGTHCTCNAYGKYYGDCKHIVALLLFLKDFQENKRRIQLREEEIIDMISYYGENTKEIKTPLNIEYNYEYNPRSVSEGSYLSLRIGEDRLYSVRSATQFFDAYNNKEKLNFGKNFSYLPNIHYFQEEDNEILDFINILHENFAENNYRAGSRNSRGIFSAKRIYLTNSSLKKFFTLMKDRSFNAIISNVDYGPVEIVEKELLFNMGIIGRNKDLMVSMNSEEEIITLTPDGEYVFSNGGIIKVPKEQRTKILPLYNEILIKGKGQIKVSHDYKEKFISDVLTTVKNAVNLKMDKDVEESIYNPDLKVEVYFDKDYDSIPGQIYIIYGYIKINPFSSREETFKDNNKILLRDREEENKVLNVLEEGDFKVIDGGIYLDDEENIFDLVTNIIPKLQLHGEIYYSDLFKEIKIRDSAHFSGGVKINEDLDLLEFDFNIDGIDPYEIDQLFNSIKEKKRFYRLKDGSFLPLDNEDLENVSDLILKLGLGNSMHNGIIQGSKHITMYLDRYLEDKSLDFIKKNVDFKKLVHDIKNPEEIDYKIPSGIKGELRDYQKFGFKWLKTLAKYGFGGILADDMGLGKTLQVLTFLLSEKNEKGSIPNLIVVPTSLVFNWEEEVNKFAPDLKILLIHGNKAERTELLKYIDQYDLIITSYPLLRRDVELYKNFIFRYCILDEAQHIKNAGSLNAKSVKSITAKNYFALTGTPMENTIMELWSIFDFLMPGYLLSNKEFIDKYERPIFKDQNMDRLKDLNKHIKPFILRRIKKEVLKELPEKIEQKIIVEMTRDQKKLYLAYIKALKDELEIEIKDKGFNRSHIKILAAITRLRQICCHPELFVEDYTGGSGKLDTFEEIINDAVEGGHRILVFSQFRSMLDIIQERFDEKGIKHMYLNGSTPMELRGQMVKDFNNGEGDVFLISLKAGGTGLNLTGADMVIHYDPWWNPAVEDQATDRAYRIGQENTVQVMRLITKGTIEEKIFKLQEKKREMIDMVIKEGETLISKLSEEEMLSLFEV